MRIDGVGGDGVVAYFTHRREVNVRCAAIILIFIFW